MMMRRSFIWLITLAAGFLLTGGILHSQELPAPINRSPVFAGSFYPGNKSALESNLRQLFDEASPRELAGRTRCLIVPHAGYPYSGVVAASGYGSIPEKASYENIFIIASSHREYFEGASVYWVGHYRTPLGEVRVNRTLARELADAHDIIRFLPAAHDREHSIEVQLPFIQYHFKEPPPIVPIVIGSSSVATARELATALKPHFKPGNLFIISSDFSHYPPFQEAVRVDRSTGNAILKNDPGLFYETLRKNSQEGVENLATPCCGWCSVLTLLYMSEGEDDLVYTPVLYRNSGHSPLGDRERVVGYWAIAGHQNREREAGFSLEKSDEQALLEISRETLEAFLETGTIPEIRMDDMPANLRQHAGAFVSLYKHGQLRGCIGNFQPGKPVYEVVREMSVAAATRDTRFFPVNEGELEQISIEISVLTPLRKISSIEEFELGRHGIYMIKDGHTGTYLPQVAGQTGWNREEFLGNCAQHKAGIGWEGWKEADLYVYEAIVFGEPH